MAHLSFNTFVYKAISTFIDDLFAFLMKDRMPLMHLIRVFRDDIVFVIYLYQRWIYKTDKNRLEVGSEFADVNVAEIKEAMEKEEEEKKAAEQNKDTEPKTPEQTEQTSEDITEAQEVETEYNTPTDIGTRKRQIPEEEN